MGDVVLAAKKAGVASIESIDMLELCVQCPARLLRTLLDCMLLGTTATSLALLSQQLQAAMDEGGAGGERGVLLVYRDLLESPGANERYTRMDHLLCFPLVGMRASIAIKRVFMMRGHTRIIVCIHISTRGHASAHSAQLHKGALSIILVGKYVDEMAQKPNRTRRTMCTQVVCRQQ